MKKTLFIVFNCSYSHIILITETEFRLTNAAQTPKTTFELRVDSSSDPPGRRAAVDQGN